MNAYKSEIHKSRITRLGFVTLIVVSVLVAILLASALNSFTRLTDSALADNSLLLQSGGRGADGGNAPSTLPRNNYLPIIFLNSATAGGAWLLAGNAGTNPANDFLGTTDNVTFTIRVSNTVAYRIAPAGGTNTPNVIGGFSGNSVADGILGATIGGGGFSGFTNHVNNHFGTVGGGQANTANGYDSTIGGGENNSANYAATVGGGKANFATSDYATIGGGYGNNANGVRSTIGGGAANTASDYAATIPGGELNVAVTYTLAAGRRAKANHQGAFVWADCDPCSGAGTDFASTADNQFLIRANGGVGINTSSPVGALDVNGQIVAGGITAPPGGEPFISEGGNSGISMNDRSGGGNPRWVIFPDSSVLQFYNGTNSVVASINTSGKLTAVGGFNGQCLAATNFDTTAGKSCNMDVAEGFASTQRTEPGDLVALVTSANGSPTVRKSSNAYDELLIGVVSQNPGLVFDNGATHLSGDNSQLITNDKTVVALVGRVNVKVSIENGIINIGDPLTSSSTPGIAMKATQAGKIIGYAMESTTNDGTVLALVQPGDYVPPAQLEALKQNAQLEAQVNQLTQQVVALQQSSSASNAFAFSNLPLWGIVGSLALLLVRRRK